MDNRKSPSREEVIAMIEKADELNMLDGLKGGASTVTLAKLSEYSKNNIKHVVEQMSEENKIVRVQGLSPNKRPRTSYLTKKMYNERKNRIEETVSITAESSG